MLRNLVALFVKQSNGFFVGKRRIVVVQTDFFDIGRNYNASNYNIYAGCRSVGKPDGQPCHTLFAREEIQRIVDVLFAHKCAVVVDELPLHLCSRHVGGVDVVSTTLRKVQSIFVERHALVVVQRRYVQARVCPHLVGKRVQLCAAYEVGDARIHAAIGNGAERIAPLYVQRQRRFGANGVAIVYYTAVVAYNGSCIVVGAACRHTHDTVADYACLRVGGNNAAVTVPVALAVALNGVFQVAVFYQTFIKGNNAAHLVACVLVDKIDDRQIANYACSVGLTDNAVVPTGQNVDVFDCIALSVKRAAEILAVWDSVAFP